MYWHIKLYPQRTIFCENTWQLFNHNITSNTQTPSRQHHTYLSTEASSLKAGKSLCFPAAPERLFFATVMGLPANDTLRCTLDSTIFRISGRSFASNSASGVLFAPEKLIHGNKCITCSEQKTISELLCADCTHHTFTHAWANSYTHAYIHQR